MKKSLLLCLFLLIGCGGGVEYTTPVSSYRQLDASIPPKVTPFFIRDLPTNTIQEPPKNSDRWSFSVRHQGSDILSVNTNNMDDLTGIGFTSTDVSNGAVELGNGRGSFFQNYSGNFGSYIDTRTSIYRKVVGGGPHMAVSYDFEIKPRVLDQWIISGYFTNKTFEGRNGVAQLSVIGYIADGDNNVIAFVFPLFDNRYNNYQSVVMSDTFVSFVSEPIQSTRYKTPLSNSSMSNTTFDNTYVSFTITEDNLKNIVEDINGFVGSQFLSSDLTKYTFSLVGVLHEVFVEPDDSYVVSGVSFKDIKFTRACFTLCR